MHLVVLVGSDIEERAATRAGIAGGAGVRADQESLVLGDRLVDRLQNVGEDRADHEVDVVSLQQSLDLDDRAVGLEFIVDIDDLDLAAAHLAAEILDRQCKAVAHLRAQRRRGAGGGHDHADLDLVLSCRAACRKRQKSRRRGKRQLLSHIPSLHITSGFGPLRHWRQVYADHGRHRKQRTSCLSRAMQGARQLLEA